MTHGQISCTKIRVRVSCTRNLDRLPSALLIVPLNSGNFSHCPNVFNVPALTAGTVQTLGTGYFTIFF